MPARIRTTHQDSVRAKIQADRLIAWLQAGVFGEKFQGKGVDLTNPRVRAAVALLNKSLPDLTKTELIGEGGGPIKTEGTVKLTPSEAYLRMLDGKADGAR